MLACRKTLRRVSPLRGSVFRWEPITWGWHGWHPRLLHATLPAFRPAPSVGMLGRMLFEHLASRFWAEELWKDKKTGEPQRGVGNARKKNEE